MCVCVKERQTEKGGEKVRDSERENECARQNERGGGEAEGERHTGKNERLKEKRKRERDSERKWCDSERERERVWEGESEKKTCEAHIMLQNVQGSAWKETSHLKSVHVYVTFYLIKPYQPFSQTRTSTTQSNHIFTRSLYL